MSAETSGRAGQRITGPELSPAGEASTSASRPPAAHLAEAIHYTGQAVIAAAVDYYKAVADEDVDQAINDLNAAVARYLAVTDPQGMELHYAHRLLGEAMPGLDAAAQGLMRLEVQR